MIVNRQVTGSRIEMRRLDASDQILIARNASNVTGNVCPVCASIAAELNIAIVGSDPKNTRQHRRFSDRGDIAVIGGSIIFRSHWLIAGHAHNVELGSVNPLRQVTGCCPGVSAIERFKKLVGADINNSRIVRRENYGRVPIKAILFTLRRGRHNVALRWIDASAESSALRELCKLFGLLLLFRLLLLLCLLSGSLIFSRWSLFGICALRSAPGISSRSPRLYRCARTNARGAAGF